MNRLSKTQLAEKVRLLQQLRRVGSKVEEALADFNRKVEEAKAPVDQAVEEYNAVLAEAKAFAEGIAADAQSHYDDKSEKWQEGERGQAYQAWVSEWENVNLDDLEVELPGEVELPELNAVDELDCIADEPGTG
jgi:hypothetical protein